MSFQEALNKVGLKFGSGVSIAEFILFIEEVAKKVAELKKEYGYRVRYNDARQKDANQRVEVGLVYEAFFVVARRKIYEEKEEGR